MVREIQLMLGAPAAGARAGHFPISPSTSPFLSTDIAHGF